LSNTRFEYHVDLTFCIDATGSMAGIIKDVQSRATSMHTKINDYLASKEKHIEQMRVRVIFFRDFFYDDNRAIQSSPTFLVPQQADELRRFIESCHADGGGDEPENALEALALAMNADWTTAGEKQRHIVVMFTDASAHPIEKAASAGIRPSQYPDGMPKTFTELTKWWNSSQEGKMHPTSKRLILFTPDDTPWNDISGDWNNAIHIQSRAGHGLSEFDMDIVLETIAGSI
jgi:hypothetical protein